MSKKDETYSLDSFHQSPSKGSSGYESSEKGFRGFINSFKPAEVTYDLEKGEHVQVTSLEDNLKEYQVKLIALGGAIGSGLFISSATALSSAGPAGCLIGYTVIAVLIYFIVQALGELTSTYPVKGNFLAYNTRFIDESWGFAMNWNYCLQWIVTIPLSLVSASLTIQFWGSSINPAAWVSIFYVIICAINICGVRGYGYGESVFSIIKVIAIVGFCFFAIIIIAGGGKEGYIGAKYWHNPGAFAHSLKGTLSTLVNAAFSFAGTELVAIAAAAAPNPRRALNNAIKQIFWRITVFYMLSIILVCFLVPYNDSSLLGNSSSSASPFVVAITNSGVKVLPSIFNVVILLAVLSVANSGVFATYKPLVALAEAGHGPKFLAYVDRKGRPIFSILIALAGGLIGFVSASDAQETVFNWLLAISGLSTIFMWFSISLAQVRVNYACRVQGVSLKDRPFNAVGGDYGAYLSMFINIIVLIAQFYVALYPVNGPHLDANGFFQAYLSAPIVLIMYVGHKIWTKNWRLYIKAEDMDISTGRNIIDPEIALQQKVEDDIRWKEQKWYYRFFYTWC